MERRILIGNKLRAARKQLGMSQTDLGKVLGCSHVAISKIERGITKLGIIDLERLASARELVKEVKRVKSDVWLFLRLLALIVACDLLLLGIGQQPLKSIWALELTKIKTLRDIIVLTSVKELPKDFRLTGRNRVLPIAQSLWDSDEQIKEKTIALVNALERLQIAQNNVRDKLRALELSLSSYPSIPIGSKT